jgi:hypothetical protein
LLREQEISEDGLIGHALGSLFDLLPTWDLYQLYTAVFVSPCAEGIADCHRDFIGAESAKSNWGPGSA